ncbi:MAG: HAD family hydrolase [Chloroflexota bacterium]
MKAVVFDLDQTLLDRDASLRAFLVGQHGRLLPNLNQAQLIERFVSLDQNGMVWKGQVYQVLAAEFQINHVEWQILLDDYVNSFHNSAIGYDDLHVMLTQLQSDGYKLGVITNGRFPFQLKNIQALNIEPFFDVILVSEKEGVRKPDPAIFERALLRLGVTAVNAVMVGDNPVADIQGAKNVGLKAIWKQNKRSTHPLEADAVCEKLMDIPRLIQTLCSPKG